MVPTGTNYFSAGLASGDPPEFWTTDRPGEVTGLHQRFVDAGADIILTNTFGCNAQRLKFAQRSGPRLRACQRAASSRAK